MKRSRLLDGGGRSSFLPRFIGRRALGLVFTSLLALGCDSEQNAPAGRRVIERPSDELESVEVSATQTNVGFYYGVLKQEAAVSSFRMGRFPATVVEYQACVDAGACSAPAEHGCYEVSKAGGPDAAEEAESAPAICVGLRQAQAFCDWYGGALPTLEQWLLAARGKDPQRYAWGNERPTLAEHPRGVPVDQADTSDASTDLQSVEVGNHPRGASAFGVEDVLSVSGELVAASKDSPFAACEAPGACVVTGVAPGAIDSVLALEANGPATTTYAFRCALKEGT